MIDSQQTIASAVLAHPECARVFQRVRIDFCCRGERSIDTASKERGIDAAALVDELLQAIAKRSSRIDVDPRELATPALISSIVSEHHTYFRAAVPFVKTLAVKVSRVHGDQNPKLRELETAVLECVDTVLPHLEDEEVRLFPALMAPETTAAVARHALASMHDEHLAVGSLLERIRTASDDFNVPPWACNSYRALFSELEQLEGDTRMHIHLENNVLAARFRPT